MSEFAAVCDRCSNPLTLVGPLYIRKDRHLCIHCIDLEEGLTSSGRISGRSARSPGNPLNQPRPYTIHGRFRDCVWCGKSAQPTYRWRGSLITACGWGCAGLWMDQQMNVQASADEEARLQAELAEGEAYVRKSLGLEQ